MANRLKMKQSSVAGKVPATTDLLLGELAVNTTDGKLYLKKNVNGTETIVDVTAGGLLPATATGLGGVKGLTNLTIDASGNLSLTGNNVASALLGATNTIKIPALFHAAGTNTAGVFTDPGIYSGLDGNGHPQIRLVPSSTGVESYIDFASISNDFKGRILYSNANNEMVFATNGNTRLKLTSNASGTVLIGKSAATDSGAYGFEVAGTSRFDKIEMGGANGILGTSYDGVTSQDANVKFYSWYGIGLSCSVAGQPTPQWHNAWYCNTRNGDTWQRGNLNVNGNAYVQGGALVVYTRANSVNQPLRAGGYIEWMTDIGAVGTTYFTSDLRQKNAVTPTQENSLAKICSVDYIDFNYNEGTGYDVKARYKGGFSAQSLQATDPLWVNEIGEGDAARLAPNPATLLPAAMHAITQLKAENDALRSDVLVLKEQVEKLLAFIK